MQKIQKGFTLIELMIVVAIIGILAAIAIPAYSDYTERAKVSELVTIASACKGSMTEYYQSEGTFPTTLDEAGCNNTVTDKIQSIAIAGGATGTITVTSNLTRATGTYVLVGTPVSATDDSVEWTCNTSTIDEKFLPANCRT
jgi:type IV pilus assembly protein PilA